ncbi:MAG: hypothetical protein V4850_22355 [Myxococcota bacterium]
MSFAPPGFEDSPLAGFDVSWLASDQEGHVAWLVTFGSAVLPPWVIASLEDDFDPEEALRALPIVGGYRSARNLARTDEQWIGVARRGIFAYDWDVYSGPYLLKAEPPMPVHLDTLPPALARLARLTRFPHLRFRDCQTIAVTDVALCTETPLSPQPPPSATPKPSP